MLSKLSKDNTSASQKTRSLKLKMRTFKTPQMPKIVGSHKFRISSNFLQQDRQVEVSRVKNATRNSEIFSSLLLTQTNTTMTPAIQKGISRKATIWLLHQRDILLQKKLKKREKKARKEIKQKLEQQIKSTRNKKNSIVKYQ